MAKPKYTVLLRTRGTIKCPEPFRFHFDDPQGRSGEVTCGNWVEAIGNPYEFHQGLLIQVELTAKDMESAIEGAGNVAEATLTALSLQCQGSAARCELDVAYNSTEGISERQFRQDFDVPVTGRPVKVAAHDAALDLLEKVGRVAKPALRDRVIRAGLSFRRGLDIEDALARFNEYWIGLECLNPLLEGRLQTEAAHWLCECGKQYKREEARGVKAFLDKICGEEVVRKVRKLRRDIFHGVEAFPHVQGGARRLAPVMEDALHKAVLYCLGVPLSEVRSLKTESLHGYFRPSIKIKATLVGKDPKKLGAAPGSHPHFEMESTLVGSAQHGDLTYQRMSHLFRPYTSGPSRLDEITFTTPRGMKSTAMKGSVISKDGKRVDIDMRRTKPKDERGV